VLLNFTGFLYYLNLGSKGISASVCFFLFVLYSWFSNIIIEATFEGHHTKKVQKNLRCGMILFIISEVMFFFSFFWAFFYTSISPAIEIGSWPPLGIKLFNPFSIPLLNTVILLSSGVCITWAHRALVGKDRENSLLGLSVTILYGFIFTLLQVYEYSSALFSINDSIYGALFYLCTGFHGSHVIIGTTLLLATYFRHVVYQLISVHHVGFEVSAWYWHFVDIVWLFLYLSVYWHTFCKMAK
jgi:cytochrome c oxidase subunit 3